MAIIQWIIKKTLNSFISALTFKGLCRYIFSFYRKPLKKNRRFIDILKEYLT